MHKFLFLVKNYVYKACNQTILNLSINLKKLRLGSLDYRPKISYACWCLGFMIICVLFCYQYGFIHHCLFAI